MQQALAPPSEPKSRAPYLGNRSAFFLSIVLLLGCGTGPSIDSPNTAGSDQKPNATTPPGSGETGTGETEKANLENLKPTDQSPKGSGTTDSTDASNPTRAETQRTLAQLNENALQKVAAGEYLAAIDPMTEFARRAPSARAHFQLANTMLMAGLAQESLGAFDRSIDVDPSSEPYLWQRGIAQYFAGQFKAGKSQFEFHQTVNSADVENAVWHMLCHAGAADIQTARSGLIPISGDPRVPMDEIYNLFAGNTSPDQVVNAAKKHPGDRQDRIKTQLYYAHLYVGLFHHMNGERAQAITAMREAEQFNTLDNGLLMGEIANIYLGQFATEAK